MNDPANSFLAYLFTIDKNLATGTFGVFKMDFTPLTLKYVYTPLTISSGLAFSVTSIFRISTTDANDFLFAGKAQILTDGTNTQIFLTSYGYVMKAKTSDPNKNCFSFPSGYSLSLANICTLDFVQTVFTFVGLDGGGMGPPISVP